MGRSSVLSAAAVRLACLDGVGSCAVLRAFARLFSLWVSLSLSLSLWAGLVIGDSWGHIGDIFDIAVVRGLCACHDLWSHRFFLSFF